MDCGAATLPFMVSMGQVQQLVEQFSRPVRGLNLYETGFKLLNCSKLVGGFLFGFSFRFKTLNRSSFTQILGFIFPSDNAAVRYVW